MALLLLLLLSCAALASAQTTTLASGCSCTTGTATLTCATSIPVLPSLSGCPDLTTVTLQGCSITTVPSNFTTGLTKLTLINLNNNLITSIGAGAFSAVSLTNITLSLNRLTTVNADIFSNKALLTTLSLANNSIASVDRDAFTGSTALARIQLQNNVITSLDAATFTSQTAMTVLNLDGNALTSLPQSIFTTLTRLLTLTLKNNNFNTANALLPNTFATLTVLTSLSLENNPFPLLDANLFYNTRALTSLTCSGVITCKNTTNNLKPNPWTNITCAAPASISSTLISYVTTKCPLTSCGALYIKRGSGQCVNPVFGSYCQANCDSRFQAALNSSTFQCTANGWVGYLSCLGAPPVCFGKDTRMQVAGETGTRGMIELWRMVVKDGKKDLDLLDVDGKPRRVKNIVAVSPKDLIVHLPANAVAPNVPSADLTLTASHMVRLPSGNVSTAGELAHSLGLKLHKPIPSNFVFHIQTESWGFLSVHGLACESAAVNADDYDAREALHSLGDVPDASCADAFKELQ